MKTLLQPNLEIIPRPTYSTGYTNKVRYKGDSLSLDMWTSNFLPRPFKTQPISHPYTRFSEKKKSKEKKQFKTTNQKKRTTILLLTVLTANALTAALKAKAKHRTALIPLIVVP